MEMMRIGAKRFSQLVIVIVTTIFALADYQRHFHSISARTNHPANPLWRLEIEKLSKKYPRVSEVCGGTCFLCSAVGQFHPFPALFFPFRACVGPASHSVNGHYPCRCHLTGSGILPPVTCSGSMSSCCGGLLGRAWLGLWHWSQPDEPGVVGLEAPGSPGHQDALMLK